MNSLYHHGIISTLPSHQMESYGFRVIEQHDDMITLMRDPVPLVLSGPSIPSSWLTWNLDHYPLTHAGTRQLEKDLAQWGISEHDRMVLLLTHQERYGPVVAYWWGRAVPPPHKDESQSLPNRG